MRLTRKSIVTICLVYLILFSVIFKIGSYYPLESSIDWVIVPLIFISGILITLLFDHLIKFKNVILDRDYIRSSKFQNLVLSYLLFYSILLISYPIVIYSLFTGNISENSTEAMVPIAILGSLAIGIISGIMHEISNRKSGIKPAIDTTLGLGILSIIMIQFGGTILAVIGFIIGLIELLHSKAKKMKSSVQTKIGFILCTTHLVIVFIVVLMALPMFFEMINRSRASEVPSVLEEIIVAESTYLSINDRYFLTNDASLLFDSLNIVRPYSSSIIFDYTAEQTESGVIAIATLRKTVGPVEEGTQYWMDNNRDIGIIGNYGDWLIHRFRESTNTTEEADITALVGDE